MGLINKICRCHQIGLTREGTFQLLCSEQNLLPISSTVISRWFKELDRNSDVGIDSTSIYYELLKKIHREFEQFQSTIFVWPKTGGTCRSFRLLDSRYSLAACGSYVPADLYLLDNYHGQMRPIQFINMDPKTPNLYFVKSVKISDSEYFLFQIKQTEITLMHLDLQNLTCTFLSKSELSRNDKKVIFDCKNRRNFCLSYFDYHNHWLKSCEIQESTLILHASVQIDLNTQSLSVERLCDNRLQAFIINDHGAECIEYNLTSDNHHLIHLKLFELDATVDFQHLTGEKHVWLNNICYILNRPRRHLEELKTQLFIFDLDTRKICQLEHVFFRVSPSLNLHVEGDGNILSVCTQNNCEKQFIRRFTLRQPDKLVDLVLFNLRKAAIFYGSKIHTKLASRFPPNLQPFPMCKLR